MATPTGLELARQTRIEMLVLQESFRVHKTDYDRLELLTLRETVAVLLSRVEKLETAKAEADKRQWQFVFITLGVIGSLLSSVVVQLLLWALKK